MNKGLYLGVILLVMLSSGIVYSQIGPMLIPPGMGGLNIEGMNQEESEGGLASGEDWLYSGDWELNASDIVFSASKKRQLISEAPSTIHVITDKDIYRYGWRSLTEILRHVPGIQTLTVSSGFQSVMIRGLVGTETNNSRILWLQNGVPLNDIRDAGLWLDDTYPVALIKRIEIVLGPGSALYGSGAFQGVVNIFTKDPKDVPSYGEYRVGLAQDLSFRSSAMAAYNSEGGDFGLMALASANTSNGRGLIGDRLYYEALLKKGGENVSLVKPPTSEGIPYLGVNSDKHWFNVFGKMFYKSLRVSALYNEVRSGFEGTEDTPYSSYRFNRRELGLELLYEKALSDSFTSLSVLSYRFMRYGYDHYADLEKSRIVSIYSNKNEKGIPESTHALSYPSDLDKKIDFVTDQHKLFALFQVQWQIYKNNEMIFGVGGEYAGIHAPEFQKGRWKLNYLTPSVFIQDEQRLFDNRLILTAGARLDYYKVNSTERKAAPSWRAAALVKWTNNFIQRLSYGYAFKEPSMYQLNADHIDTLGNRKLNSETVHNVELSSLWRIQDGISVRLDGFLSFMDNLILMGFETSQASPELGISGRYIPDQSLKARIFGFELSGDFYIKNGWRIYSHYNFLFSQMQGGSSAKSYRRIPDDAMHRVMLGGSYGNENFVADLGAFFVSPARAKGKEGVRQESKEDVAMYFVLQPHVSIHLPADFALLLQGSFTFSENMSRTPTHYYYYETRSVPVARYSAMLGIMYPYVK